MPPRKIKPKAAPLDDAKKKELQDHIDATFEDLKAKLLRQRDETCASEIARVLASIPQDVLDMPLHEFLASSPPIDLFAEAPEAVVQEEKEAEQLPEEDGEDVKTGIEKLLLEVKPEQINQSEHQEKEPESGVHVHDAEIDDAAHETSIPIVHSGHNSGRNTATDAMRHELITPSGHVLTVSDNIIPKLKKPSRKPRHDEEIAFSVDGTPIALKARREGADGNLVPKEEPGTPV